MARSQDRRRCCARLRRHGLGCLDSFELTTPRTRPGRDDRRPQPATNEWRRSQSGLSLLRRRGHSQVRRATRKVPVLGRRHRRRQRLFLDADNAHQPANAAITSRPPTSPTLGPRRHGRRLGDHVGARLRRHRLGRLGLIHVDDASEHAPVATINDHSLHTNEWSQVQSWISYSDADGNAATQYQFWDGGTGASSGYFWTPANAHHAGRHAITVAAADLANVWVRGGTAGGSETMWVRAFDGTDWGAWDAFSFTTTATRRRSRPSMTTVCTPTNGRRSQSWISYSDADGNAATQYQFWDGGVGANSGYFWTPSNAHHPAIRPSRSRPPTSPTFGFAAARPPARKPCRCAPSTAPTGAPGTRSPSRRVANTPPVATINDHTLHVNEWSQVAAGFRTPTPMAMLRTQYQFWDGGTAADSGYFWTPDNAHHAAGTAIRWQPPTSTMSGFAAAQAAAPRRCGCALRWHDWSAWDAFTLLTV